MTVRRFEVLTQWFKSAHGSTIDYAVVERKHAGENAPAAPHGPGPIRPETTQDLDTLCVDGLGLNVCPSSQSDICVAGWTGVGASERTEQSRSQLARRPQMSATPHTDHESKRDLVAALDRADANRCRRCKTLLPPAAELDVPGDDRRECPRCRFIQEVPAA